MARQRGSIPSQFRYKRTSQTRGTNKQLVKSQGTETAGRTDAEDFLLSFGIEDLVVFGRRTPGALDELRPPQDTCVVCYEGSGPPPSLL